LDFSGRIFRIKDAVSCCRKFAAGDEKMQCKNEILSGLASTDNLARRAL
jgi:hypothetical protein